MTAAADGPRNETDRRHLARCVELAETALGGGNDPFGSLLVGGDGRVLFEDHNRTATGDGTLHPEFTIAQWAARNLSPEERRAATVYTTGEHCPMCAAAHGWVGLGRIVFASSSEQLVAWLRELGADAAPVATLPIRAVVPAAVADGPYLEFGEPIRRLHERHRAGAGD